MFINLCWLSSDDAAGTEFKSVLFIRHHLDCLAHGSAFKVIKTYLKIGMEHGASVALAEQGVQAGGIAALCPRLQNAALPDAPPHSVGTERLSCLAALSAQGNTFQVFHLCARLARRENRFCHAHANFEIGSN
jgi:hypothetical protein